MHSAMVIGILFLSVTDTGCDLVTKDPTIKSRELFISDTNDTYPISTLT